MYLEWSWLQVTETMDGEIADKGEGRYSIIIFVLAYFAIFHFILFEGWGRGEKG